MFSPRRCSRIVPAPRRRIFLRYAGPLIEQAAADGTAHPYGMPTENVQSGSTFESSTIRMISHRQLRPNRWGRRVRAAI